ncbi:MAG: hypothetical protein NTW55_01530, partial [Planctomycetota bacterium]|nr:hypothetical protein [Planctomycetota bacterium]
NDLSLPYPLYAICYTLFFRPNAQLHPFIEGRFFSAPQFFKICITEKNLKSACGLAVVDFFLTSYFSMAYDLRLVVFSCRLTYFGHTLEYLGVSLEYLWSALECVWMSLDDLGGHWSFTYQQQVHHIAYCAKEIINRNPVSIVDKKRSG